MTNGMQDEPEVSREYCARMSALARHGSELGLAMADTATVAPGSPLQVLELRRPHIHDRSWPADEATLLREALVGFVAVAAFQLRGVASLIGAGPPVPLHPLVILVRGIAEACGQCWWHVEPWISDAGAYHPIPPSPGKTQPTSPTINISTRWTYNPLCGIPHNRFCESGRGRFPPATHQAGRRSGGDRGRPGDARLGMGCCDGLITAELPRVGRRHGPGEEEPLAGYPLEAT